MNKQLRTALFCFSPFCFLAINYESIFQLCKDAVILKDHITVIRDGVLIASLFDNILLRVELAFHPFEDGKNSHGLYTSKQMKLCPVLVLLY